MNEESWSTEHPFKASDKPSEDLSRSWHRKMSRDYERATSVDLVGKWCIFVPRAEVDVAWEKIKGALEQNHLWCAKVSTALRMMSREIHVICVYTANWTDKQDVMRSRDALSAIGFVEELGYKRDVDTRNKVCGAAEWYLRA